jgi:polysaccharide deacetylase 2 family uncharacterized protein YibQ
MDCKSLINPVTNPNLVSSHLTVTLYKYIINHLGVKMTAVSNVMSDVYRHIREICCRLQLEDRR